MLLPVPYRSQPGVQRCTERGSCQVQVEVSSFEVSSFSNTATGSLPAGAPVLVVSPGEFDSCGINRYQRLAVGLGEDPSEAANGDVQVHAVGQVLCPPPPNEGLLQHQSLPADEPHQALPLGYLVQPRTMEGYHSLARRLLWPDK